MENGELETHGLAPLAFSIGQWSMSMGMHTLIHADGILDMYDLKDPYRMLLRNIQLQLNAMQWQPLAGDPFDDAELDQKVDDLCRTLFSDLCSEKQHCLTLGSFTYPILADHPASQTQATSLGCILYVTTSTDPNPPSQSEYLNP